MQKHHLNLTLGRFQSENTANDCSQDYARQARDSCDDGRIHGTSMLG